MITGDLKGQVDQVWNAFWTGGISNPISVIEQFTSLLFIRRLDEAMLFEPPFTDQSDQGIMGVFTDDAEVRSIIRILDGINANAEVA